jgi:hypothetical protein
MEGQEPNVWVRERGWLFLKVDLLPDGKHVSEKTAKNLHELFTRGGDLYVAVRGDVVEGLEHNLVIPLDAASGYWESAVEKVHTAVGGTIVSHTRVTTSYPAIPHQAHCFITKDEFSAYPLHEYSPPGRHPQSPGANPWG